THHPAPSDDEGKQRSGDRDDERQHQQEVHASRRSPSSPASSGRSVVDPQISNSRSSKATDSAVAQKATTMPVMTSACGTGSAAKPAAAPLRATIPNSRKTPLPSRLKPSSLRSGWGWTRRP